MAKESNYRNLNSEEEQALSAGLNCIRRFAISAGKSLSSDGTISDIDVLQSLFDENEFRHDSDEAIGAGLAFGLVLKRFGELIWVRMQDEWGKETSLKLPNYEYFIHPISILTKRFERREEIELRYLFDELLRRIREDGPQQMPTPS